jgi:hypothetical protein
MCRFHLLCLSDFDSSLIHHQYLDSIFCLCLLLDSSSIQHQCLHVIKCDVGTTVNVDLIDAMT